MNATKIPEEKGGRSLEPTVFVLCAVIVLTLILGGVFDLLYNVYRESLIKTLNRATELVTFFANVAVLFFAFPAFTRTKDHRFLSIALAALLFAYGTLFGLVLSAKQLTTGAKHISHVETTWYYTTQYSTHIVGLILYAYGVIALIRSDRTHDLTKR